MLTDGADHEVALAEEVAECDADEDGGDAAADEALPRLLGAELDEARPPHEKAEHVGHDVVDHDHHDREDVPDEAFEEVLQIVTGEMQWLQFEIRNEITTGVTGPLITISNKASPRKIKI